MSSENTRRKALQIIQNEGVKQISPESFLVKSPSGSEYEVNVKTNEEENKDGKKEVVSMQISGCSCPHGDAVELYVLGKNSDGYYCHECQVAFSSEELLTQHLAEKQTEESK